MADDVQTSEDTTEAPAEERKSYSQSELDRMFKERVARERAQFGDLNELRRKSKEYDKLVESQKTEQEKMVERLAEFERKASEAELRALRLEVATSKGLTPIQAKRLQGTTKEELELDADEILEAFGPKAPAAAPVSRPRPALTPTPLSVDADLSKPDMNDWMRAQKSR